MVVDSKKEDGFLFCRDYRFEDETLVEMSEGDATTLVAAEVDGFDGGGDSWVSDPLS